MKDKNSLRFTDKELATYMEYDPRSLSDLKHRHPQRYQLLRLGYSVQRIGFNEKSINYLAQMKHYICTNNLQVAATMMPINSSANPNDMREEIEQMISEGKSLGLIGREIGISPRDIRNAVEKWGGNAAESVALRSAEGRLHNLRSIYIIKDRYLETSRNTREWGGADVIITSDESIASSTNKTVVCTKHARVLSWLFKKLGDIFTPYLDHVTKYQFYGRLADSANDYLQNNPDLSEKDLLLYVHTEARKIFSELKNAINQNNKKEQS